MSYFTLANSTFALIDPPSYFAPEVEHIEYAIDHSSSFCDALALALVSLGYDKDTVELFAQREEEVEHDVWHNELYDLIGEAHELKSRDCI